MKIQISSPTFNSESSTNATAKVTIGNLETFIALYIEGEKVEKVFTKELQGVMDAGIISIATFSALEIDYRAMVDNAEEIRLEAKKAKHREDYQKEWFVNEEWPSAQGVTFEIVNEDYYAERRANFQFYNKGITVKYKNVSATVERVNTSTLRSRVKNIKYQVCDSLTQYKKKNYATFEKAVKGIVKMVEEQIETKAYQARQAEISKVNKTNKLERLRALFGQVVITQEYRSGYKPGSMGYHVDVYKVVVFDRAIAIEEQSNGLYTFSGLKDLSAEQIKAIVAVF